MPKVKIETRLARRFPDPFSNSAHATERHIFFVPVKSLPAAIALDPAPRAPKTRWDVYKEVLNSLLDKDCTPGTFHLKNRGITIVARDVTKVDDDQYEIHLAEGDGVIDGMHTYRLIMEAQQDTAIEIPAKQFVKLEVITKVPTEWLPEISRGLNSSMLSQRGGLAHLQDALEWIKTDFGGEKYARAIAWSEEERGSFEVRDLLCLLACFNTASYPNAGTHQPVVAYDNKAAVLTAFEEDYRSAAGKAHLRLRPLMKDILQLHDTVQLEFPKILAQSGLKTPHLIETAVKRPFEFPFLQARSTERLHRGALLPVVAAFRWLVEDNPLSGDLRWRGGFGNVLARWRTTADKLVARTVDRYNELRNIDALGRSASHWSMLHKEVAFVDLLAASQPPAAQAAGAAQPMGAATRRP
jgi:hypothetical protein